MGRKILNILRAFIRRSRSSFVQFKSHSALFSLVSFDFLQEAIVKIMKMRKRITNAALQTELVEILKNMFIPQKKMIKEQIEWLIDHKYLRRDEEDINTFLYVV